MSSVSRVQKCKWITSFDIIELYSHQNCQMSPISATVQFRVRTSDVQFLKYLNNGDRYYWLHQKEDYEDLKLKTSTKLSLLGDFRIWVGFTVFMTWAYTDTDLDLIGKQISNWSTLNSWVLLYKRSFFKDTIKLTDPLVTDDDLNSANVDKYLDD